MFELHSDLRAQNLMVEQLNKDMYFYFILCNHPLLFC